MKRPFLTMMLGDFNDKNKLWFDQDNTAYEESILHDLIVQYGLTQIIHEPTQILDSSVSFIDLVFTLVTNSRVHSSLHPNCHHQTIFSNFNLKIYFHLHMKV